MSFTVDLDVGGTFTDCYVTQGARNGRTPAWTKVDTTPHDLTVGWLNAVNRISSTLGFDKATDFLHQIDVLRISTTAGTNALIQQTGQKLGLLVTTGAEGNAYALGANPALDYLVPGDLILGIKGEVDVSGRVIQPIDESEVLQSVRELLNRGARAIVISLRHSGLNPELERNAKRAIERRYPPHYLGSVRVVLATEISLCQDDLLRTNAALLNAYIHHSVAGLLYKGEAELQRSGYPRPIFVVNNWGGVARVARTKAIMTCYSGPAAGVSGAALIARKYDVPHCVTFDVGGTSTDVGLILDGKTRPTAYVEIGGVPVKELMTDVGSAGAGGGTIARIVGGAVRMGPESAGAIPGPICYDLGGAEPTLTDALVVLGLLNPDYFLGGRRKLNAAKAYSGIREKIATPLGISVEEAASMMKDQIKLACASFVQALLDREHVSGPGAMLISYGGGGGLLAAETSAAVGISTTCIPPFASCLSAFGASVTPISHEYEISSLTTLSTRTGTDPSFVNPVNQAIEKLKSRALEELALEGFDIANVTFDILFELRSTEPPLSAFLPFDAPSLAGPRDVEALCEQLDKVAGAAVTGAVILDRIRLTASIPFREAEWADLPLEGADAVPALRGERNAYWGNGWQATTAYEAKLLRPGNQVVGPAVIEAEDTTVLIPPGRKYRVDRYGFGFIEEV